jgi:hypothetical protein
VALQPAHNHDTPDASIATIISRAQTHHTEASDSQLTVGSPKTTYNSSHTGSKFTNLFKVNQVTSQWRQKKLEARLHEGPDNAITIVASL